MHDEKFWSPDAFSTIKQILLERQVNLPEQFFHSQKTDDSNISSTKQLISSSLKEKVERFRQQQSYLIAYITFTTLTATSTWLLSFFGIPPLIRFFLLFFINHGIFAIVIQRYVLPYE